MDKASVVFDWKIDSLQDILGLIGIIVVIGIVIMMVASIFSKNGFQIGKFRMGRRGKHSMPECLSYVEEHTKTLENLVTINKGQQLTLAAVAAACEVLLAKMEGEAQNGNVRKIRNSLMKAEGYREAVEENIHD
jgi:hypothetical protein